ncbi:HEAT repeat domain-containing protein [Cylindrospermum sp. FACHB-282]|uniref:HEAT repeat domain-containing protein n=1 Tax=Cylindrospermum sp. FACHB-282 TaxID=2692794 RepID=UPI001686B15D|nr:HEAT repeat domain-containing protein [Cylindrospermum sp. FACHB-282]MBD2385881.1 HEAT repeat domain-containing protein [Cylindrospermum sp. FACHB-282]
MHTHNSHHIEQLISQLNHASTPQDAIAAITALATSGIKEATVINALIQALSHHHPSVGAASVEALVQLAPATVKALIAAFAASSDQGLQAYIIQALAQIGDPEALDLLAEVVGVAVANHCQGNVRRIAARGLGRIGSTSNDTEVIRRIEDKLTWALLTPEDWGLRYAAAVSLQEIATPGAGAALQQATDQEVDKVVLSRIATALAALNVVHFSPLPQIPAS